MTIKWYYDKSKLITTITIKYEKFILKWITLLSFDEEFILQYIYIKIFYGGVFYGQVHSLQTHS